MKFLHTLFLLSFVICGTTATAQTFYIAAGADVETASSLSFNGTTLNGSRETSSIDSISLTIPNLKFVGGDLSLLTKYERQNANYRDASGNTISDLLPFLKQQGWNTIRVRLFTDPTKSDDSKSVVQDLDYVKELGQRIKAAGMLFMLDFHYSDTWADPGAQWTPDAWKQMTDSQLGQQLYEYTRDCLNELIEAGAAPDFIQTGNEISYGMLWGTKGTNDNRCYTNSPAANWNRFTTLLKQAAKACRETCPRAQIIIHSERTPKPGVMTDFFDRMKAAAIDYDIIGLSYYPYFHGQLSVLETAIKQLEAKNYGKHIQIVEMGYPSKWAVPGTTVDCTASYPYSEAGQQKLVADLITMLKGHPLVNGLNWWYAEANASGTTGDLKTGWYNAGLFDNNTGKVLPALSEMAKFKN